MESPLFYNSIKFETFLKPNERIYRLMNVKQIKDALLVL